MTIADEAEIASLRSEIIKLMTESSMAEAGKKAWVEEFDKLVKENLKLKKENTRLKEEIALLKK